MFKIFWIQDEAKGMNEGLQCSVYDFVLFVSVTYLLSKTVILSKKDNNIAYF